MPFGPSVRSDLECTAVPTAAEVGVNSAGVVGGVSTSAASSPSAVPTGNSGRSCGSPHQPPRATVQRTGSSEGGRDGATSAPRGYSAGASATPTAADAPPKSPTPQPSSLPCGRAPVSRGASDVKASAVAFPVLTRATAARASSTPHEIGASATTSASSSSSAVALPPLQPRRASSSAAESSRGVGGSSNKPSSRWASPDRPSGASSPTGTRAAVAPLPSLSVSAAGQHPAIGADAATVSDTTGSPRVDARSLSSVSPSNGQRESYFRENNIPSLFNEMSEALLDAQPEDPVSFMKEWLQRRREAIAQ
ncbi:hypothetical_protein [Leishmania infantum]|uniref:Hypothetical_protein n=1 Tax=Leishmania infantum TaxID=5671 RepID=A0A6L0XS34_LEIIN|nr:hypothetical_protein [Leishmania infantum]SUZ45870.1 hypothetical_protein [Leishmania infantum]